LGLIIGLAGRRIYIAGYQQVFSIAMGIVVLGLAVIYFLQKRSVNIPLFNRFYLKVQQVIGSLLKSSKGLAGFLLIGMANGLLPCGMVYIAIASVLSFTEIGESAAFMAMFGAGTLPAMMLVAYAGQMMKPAIRLSMRKAVPVLVSLVGIILILRGLNLGIPFISPELPGAPGESVICHP
jgi:sulfite exporter TauE/SafE